jgi:hypothetical protein
MQHPTSGDVRWVKSDGTLPGDDAALVTGVTYYGSVQGSAAPWSSVQFKWDSSIIATITFESSNLDEPDRAGGNDFYGGIEIYAAAAGGWATESAMGTVTVAGGSASNQMVHFAGSGAKRMRAKLVVGGTGGKLRGIPHHKS